MANSVDGGENPAIELTTIIWPPPLDIRSFTYSFDCMITERPSTLRQSSSSCNVASSSLVFI